MKVKGYLSANIINLDANRQYHLPPLSIFFLENVHPASSYLLQKEFLYFNFFISSQMEFIPINLEFWKLFINFLHKIVLALKKDVKIFK